MIECAKNEVKPSADKAVGRHTMIECAKNEVKPSADKAVGRHTVYKNKIDGYIIVRWYSTI
jgi:hypothetical protein